MSGTFALLVELYLKKDELILDISFRSKNCYVMFKKESHA